jgi:polysaccharide export outer membrane protein
MNHASYHTQPAKFFIGTLALCSVMGASAVGQQSNPHPATRTAIIPANNTSSNTPSIKSSYVIGPGDLLAINVLHEPEVSQKVPVRMDGKITMPLIGEIQASGMMPDNLQAAIAQKLHDYIKDAEVTVVVEETKSRQFSVMGEVEHPGSFPLVRPTTILDGLAQAGGFRDFAKVSKIRVLRKTPQGTTVTLPFNYKQVSKGQNDSQNIELQPGDTIIVP